MAILVLSAITPIRATASSEGALSGLARVSELRSIVEGTNACELPGVSIKFDSFVPAMWMAVSRGEVQQGHAQFVFDGLRYGFTAGIDAASLHGHRWIANYESAIEA